MWAGKLHSRQLIPQRATLIHTKDTSTYGKAEGGVGGPSSRHSCVCGGWMDVCVSALHREGASLCLSVCLRNQSWAVCVCTGCDERWATVFEGIPAAPAGQQGGPLAQLESIGTIWVKDIDAAGIDRLQVITKDAHVHRRVCVGS